MHEDACARDMRHDRHQIEGLMAGGLVNLKRIGQSPVIVARIGHTPYDRDRDLINTDGSVKHIDRTDEACCVAACQLQIVRANALFIVRIAVEEHVSDLIFLAALEHGFCIVLFVDLFVLCADAAGAAVEHNIHFLHEFLKRAGIPVCPHQQARYCRARR